ncbi:hypothetical protein D3C77_498780 [compost metagenome]
MAVFSGADGVFTVIDMNNRNSVQTNQLIKFLKHAIHIIHNIITGIMDMTGVQANRQTLVMLYFIDNGGNFLKAAPHLRTFARHRLKRDVDFRLIRSIQYFVQPLSDAVYSVFRIHIRKCTRVKYDISYAQCMGPPDFFLQKIYGKLIGIRLI